MKKSQGILLAAVAVLLALVSVSLFRGNRPNRGETVVSVSPTARQEVPQPAGAASGGVLTLPVTQTPTARGTLPYVLTGDRPFDKALREAVEAKGAKTVCLMEANALLIEADAATRARLASDRRFTRVEEFVPAGKVQPELAKLIADGAESVDVSVVSLAAADRRTVLACLERGGGELLPGCINEGDTLRVRLPAALVAALAARGDVRWLERFERPQLMNDLAVQSAAMDVLSVWDLSRDLGLTGVGQKITTSDSGIDTGDLETMHPDLKARVKGMYISAGCDREDANGHGTHTAGSIVGDGSNCEGRYRGTAHGADLYAWFCGKAGGRGIYTPDSASDLFRPEGVEAYVHSASWGSASAGAYTTSCADYDRYVWQNPEFLPVFSAGNEGAGAKTIGSPGAAKNVLTVGATCNMPAPSQTASFSSRGPCQDGRTKPDIAAPGHPVTSTRSSRDGDGVTAGYTKMSGTSMSCPLTAGSVVLTRQWLVEKMGFADADGTRPTAALMKAVITGGAKGASVPNNDQGWGRVELADTLAPTNGCAVKLVDRIPFAAGQVFEYLVETTNAAPLDVQLCWVDYPGSPVGPQTSRKLVNDLDLTVEALDGDGTLHLGNGGETADTVNNMESVRLSSAAPDKYLITVTCKTVVYDHTDGGAAALYIRGAFDPAARPTGIDRVRIRREPDVTYTALEGALAAVQSGDTVEILRPVSLRRSVVLTNSCTIVATNPVASASLVTRVDDASLTVTNAVLTLSNVAFSASDKTLVTVKAGGNLTLAEDVVTGVDQTKVVIATAEADGFTLAAPLTGESFLFHCDAATAAPLAFGTFSCDPAVAEEAAKKIVCADDGERETRGAVQGGTLVWQVMPVPVADAAGYFVDATGVTNAYARLDRALQMFVAAAGAGTLGPDPVLVVRNRPDLLLSQVLETSSRLTIRGEEGASVTNLSGAVGFKVLAGGRLAVENLGFDGYRGTGLLVVDGGELVLSNCTVRNVTGSGLRSGALQILSGKATVRGGLFSDCRLTSLSMNFGGAVYVNRGAELELTGATITNCHAHSYGGAVYVSPMASVKIGGLGLSLRGNTSGSGTYEKADNLYLAGTNAALVVTEEINGERTVGLRVSGRNAVGDVFAAVAGLTPEAYARTAQAFFNDNMHSDPEVYAYAAVNPDVGVYTRLAWAKTPARDPRVPESEAAAEVAGSGGLDGFYATIEDAFAAVRQDGAVLTVLKDCTLATDVAVTNAVTVGSKAGDVFTVTRTAGCAIAVRASGALELKDVVFAGAETEGNGVVGVLFDVCGGRLTLSSGAVIRHVFGSDKPWDGAVRAYAGAVFTMKEGAVIHTCRNSLARQADAAGYGGALNAAGAEVNLLGGAITNCSAYLYGGGVYVGSSSRLAVSGGLILDGNLTASGRQSNLSVSENSDFAVTGPVTGFVGYRSSSGVQTQVFATAVGAWRADHTSLTNTAASFRNDETGFYGVAVTNASDKVLLVWSRFIGPDGSFINREGGRDVTYGCVGEIPLNPIAVTPTPIAFTSIVRNEGEQTCTVTFTNTVRGCWYSIYAIGSGAETPVLRFQAERDGKQSLTLPCSKTSVFWRIAADAGEVDP